LTATPSPEKRIDTGRIARSTGLVMGALAAAKVVGLVRQRTVAGVFGTGAQYDAYVAADVVPGLLFTLLAGGALAHAFIPVLSGYLARDDRDGTMRLASGVINTVFLLVAALAGLVALVAPVLVRAAWGVGPGFDPAQQALTTQLMRIFLFSTLIFAVSSIFSGILHAHQHFLLPALAPIAYDVGIIFGALILAPRLGIFGLAWGAVIGALLHAGLQVPGLAIYHVRWRPLLGWTNPALWRVGVLMIPRVVDLLMARMSIQWINANIASRLGEGSVSALNYAWQLMQMPETIIGTSIAIVIFPTMAELAGRKDVESQRRALSGSLRAILGLTLPAAVGLLVLGRPAIQILFQGGEFTAQSTDLVFWALQFYALGLITHSLLEVTVRAFFAQQDTLTPLIVSFFTTALNIGLALTLIRPLAHGGLALANSLAVGVESVIGLTILHIRWGGVDGRRLLAHTLKAGLAAGLMGAAIIGFQALISPGPLMLLAGGGALGCAVYFGMALLLGIDEIRRLPRLVLRRAGVGN
jgi:putative peptidoglycan lipid II flippase